MKPHQLGQFDYDECFLGPGGFLTPEANEEKHTMSFYLQELAAELARQGVILAARSPCIGWSRGSAMVPQPPASSGRSAGYIRPAS